MTAQIPGPPCVGVEPPCGPATGFPTGGEHGRPVMPRLRRRPLRRVGGGGHNTFMWGERAHKGTKGVFRRPRRRARVFASWICILVQTYSGTRDTTQKEGGRSRSRRGQRGGMLWGWAQGAGARMGGVSWTDIFGAMTLAMCRSPPPTQRAHQPAHPAHRLPDLPASRRPAPAMHPRVRAPGCLGGGTSRTRCTILKREQV